MKYYLPFEWILFGGLVILFFFVAIKIIQNMPPSDFEIWEEEDKTKHPDLYE